MGAFKIENPLMVAMIKIANMMIVSFFWLLCCLPVVTIVPATAALYHTTVKVIRKTGSGVATDFFKAFKGSLKRGIPLSLIFVVTAAMLYFALSYAIKMQRENMFGTIYFIIGCIIVAVWASASLHIPFALSRFEGKLDLYIRMGLYFGGKNLGLTILRLILLAVVALLVDFYPIALLILPGLYMDLIASGVEKQLLRFMEENGLEDSEPSEEVKQKAPAGKAETLSSLDMEKLYGEESSDE